MRCGVPGVEAPAPTVPQALRTFCRQLATRSWRSLEKRRWEFGSEFREGGGFCRPQGCVTEAGGPGYSTNTSTGSSNLLANASPARGRQKHDVTTSVCFKSTSMVIRLPWHDTLTHNVSLKGAWLPQAISSRAHAAPATGHTRATPA